MDGFPGDGDHPDVRSPTMDDQEVFDGMRERERHAQTFLGAFFFFCVCVWLVGVCVAIGSLVDGLKKRGRGTLLW